MPTAAGNWARVPPLAPAAASWKAKPGLRSCRPACNRPFKPSRAARCPAATKSGSADISKAWIRVEMTMEPHSHGLRGNALAGRSASRLGHDAERRDARSHAERGIEIMESQEYMADST